MISLFRLFGYWLDKGGILSELFELVLYVCAIALCAAFGHWIGV